jgi:hypothetical protein
MVAEPPSRDGDGLVVLADLALGGRPAGIEPVEEDLFPVDGVVARRFSLRGIVLGRGIEGRQVLVGRQFLVLLVVRLDEIEERIVQQLLLEVLLQVEEGHVEQIHRLVQARIDLQFLAQMRALLKTCFHAMNPVSWERRRSASGGVP